jgi:hypothetical protein
MFRGYYFSKESYSDVAILLIIIASVPSDIAQRPLMNDENSRRPCPLSAVVVQAVG